MTDHDQQAISPCKCGGVAELMTYDNEDHPGHGPYEYAVRCQSCRDEGIPYDTASLAITWWNAYVAPAQSKPAADPQPAAKGGGETVACRNCLDTGIASLGKDEGEDFCEACPVGREKSLAAELEEESNLRECLGSLLEGTANALKGEPPELTRHDWSDLPKVAAAVVAERDYVAGYLADLIAIRKTLDAVNAPHDPEDGASLEPTRIRLLGEERDALAAQVAAVTKERDQQRDYAGKCCDASLAMEAERDQAIADRDEASAIGIAIGREDGRKERDAIRAERDAAIAGREEARKERDENFRLNASAVQMTDRRCDALQAECDRLRQGSWVSVEDRLPAMETVVLIAQVFPGHGYNVQTAFMRMHEGQLGWHGHSVYWHNQRLVTHWMPLPPSPTTQEPTP